MPNIGGPELIFILAIVLIIFGAGRLPEVFGQLGKGVRSFREESGKEGSPAATSTAIAGDDRHCTNCGKPLADGAKFCASCGTPVAPS